MAAVRRYRPALETLETRLNPGAITAALSFGTLTLTGSIAADQLTMTQPAAGQITLTPSAGNALVVNGVNQGDATAVTFGTAAAPVRNLTANLGAGSDSFNFTTFTDITLAGSLTINLGEGAADQFTLGSGQGGRLLTVGGNLTVTAGAGDNLVLFGNCVVGGNVTLNLGGGANLLTLAAFGGNPNNQVRGAVGITLGTGADLVNVSGTDVTGRVTINVGAGDQVNPARQTQVTLTGSAVAPMRLNGGVTIQAAADARSTVVTFAQGIEVGTGGVAIQLGNGADTVALTGLVNHGATTINTAGGADLVQIDGGAAIDAVFERGVQINLGEGNDTLTVGSAGNVFVSSFASFQLGAGDDSAAVGGGNLLTFGATATIDGGTGLDQHTITLAGLGGSAFLPGFHGFEV